MEKETKEVVVHVGITTLQAIEILEKIKKIEATYKFHFPAEEATKIEAFAFVVMLAGIEIGVNREQQRLKKECDAAEIEFQKIREFAGIMQKINLTIIPAKGEA